MISGNTDWSVQYQQNIKLITVDSTSLPGTIPYDFDHAGIVRAPYANPAEELQINDPEKAREAFSYPCDRSGTGNIVIKGLKKNE